MGNRIENYSSWVCMCVLRGIIDFRWFIFGLFGERMVSFQEYDHFQQTVKPQICYFRAECKECVLITGAF